mmetsp:Transcript_7164/g.11653  ORF Transcript_7164/g.11653 Transcript_7164/m.11653 type:complete len:489 (-) Transcript_7164:233-1699(-)
MDVLRELRTFVEDRKSSLEWRREQLEILRQAMIDEKDAMCEALQTDLCVDSSQATILQIGSIFGEIDTCLDGMTKWSALRPVATPLALQPAQSYVQYQPKGVVLVLGAWNYPFNVTLGPVICALAAGNCVVVKPSEQASESAKAMERMLGKLDQRAVRCVLGGQEVSENLIKQPFDHIVYTGGPRVAKLVLAAAAPNLTPVTLELGGKSPVIIMKGTNLVEACRRISCHKFTNTGQTCIAPDYVLVHQDVRDEVAKLLTENVKAMFGASPETAEHLGRMVHKNAADRLRTFLQEDHGGNVLFGGKFPDGFVREGHRYVPPTLILDPRKDAKVMEEELFGPILPVVTVQSCSEAIEIVKSKPKPLALYIFAPKKETNDVIEATSSGAVVMGDAMLHKGNPHLPFGGIGNSGMGRMHGEYGFREFSNERAVMNRPLFLPSPLSLPIPKPMVAAAWVYATSRPLKTMKKQAWKLLAVFLVLLSVYMRRGRR